MPPSDSEVELAAFAGEVGAPPAPSRARTFARLRTPARIGLTAGLLPAIAMFGIYYVQHHALRLPWPQLATVAAVFGTSIGVSLTVAVDLTGAAFDRIAALGFGLRLVANPLTAGIVGGAVAGIGPGVVATTAFHDYRGPFVGTALIGGSLLAGALLVAVPLAWRARRSRRVAAPADRWILVGAVALATLVVGLAWTIGSPLMVRYAYAEAYGAVSTTGARAGALAGCAGGAALGGYVGLVIALGRGRRRAT